MTIQPNPTAPLWPTEWQGSRITGRFLTINGTPVVGTVAFTPTTQAVIAGASKTIIIGSTITVPLTGGAIDVIIPATDDPDTNPSGFTYTVTENFPGGRTYSISAPANATQDMTTLVPVTASGGAVITRGETGPAGPPGPGASAGTVRFRAYTHDVTGVNLAATTFTTVPMDNLDYNIGGGTWDDANDTWTVPTSGLYLCAGGLRIADSATARSTFIGIHTSNVDGAWGTWQQMGGIQRDSRKYLRLAYFAAGSVLRLYTYSEGSTFPLNSAEFTATLLIAT